MFNKNNDSLKVQSQLFNTYLKDIILSKHPLVFLANSINWSSFNEELEG